MSAFDAFAQYHYELQLRLKFHEETGDAFQVLFSRLMSKTYPGDFQPTRPWGNVGDRKCDGYRVSTRELYQCYAPSELTLEKAKAKILDDFEGALAHHGEFWDTWVFVHNAVDGRLATDVMQLLEEMRQKHPGMMLMKLAAKRSLGPGFLVHDSHLFDGVDERQVGRAFVIGAKQAQDCGWQYIVTINSDDLFRTLPEGFELNNYILPTQLTDARADGGLFGMRF